MKTEYRVVYTVRKMTNGKKSVKFSDAFDLYEKATAFIDRKVAQYAHGIFGSTNLVVDYHIETRKVEDWRIVK